ncbi:hypothetical protein E2C01_040311 [Portunus trituberculatus]|uniref:Uncharacterized protein n=1 Tax=Portunus trituberculatus TaxID=210409 RepID=A0A5B7FN00_PORTR|nr:hypothetical protein [Portunus trituberculatus]
MQGKNVKDRCNFNCMKVFLTSRKSSEACPCHQVRRVTNCMVCFGICNTWCLVTSANSS